MGRGAAPELAPKGYWEGTHRAVTPAQTLQRIRPLLPVFGITRIAELTRLDRVGLPVVQCIRPNARSLSVSQGKGLDLISAKVSALMESIETYHAETIELPLRFAAYEDLCYREKLARVEEMVQEGAGFDPLQRTMWIEVTDVLNEQSLFAPFEAFHADFTLPALPGSGMFACSTNGLASGNSYQEALLHALCEIVERDAETLWNLAPEARLSETAVELSRGCPEACQDLLERIAAAGLSAVVWDLTSDVGLPVFQCLVCDPDGAEDAEIGLGCHPSRDVALARAITEALQVRLTVIAGSRDDLTFDDYAAAERQQRRSQVARLLEASARPGRSLADCPHFHHDRFSEDIELVLENLRAVGIEEVLVADLTKETFQIPVVSAVVPGLEGAWEAFDPDCLEDALSPRARAAAEGRP